MAKVWIYTLTLMMVLSLVGPGAAAPLGAAPALAQSGGVYEEDFSTYTYRDLNATTADWDIFTGELRMGQYKALYWQTNPAAALGSDGYLYIVWHDERNDEGDIYAQKYDLTGNRQWPTDVRVNSDSGTAEQKYPNIVAGVDGNLYVFWADNRSGEDLWSVYAQKLNGNGTRLWSTDKQVNEGTTASSWSDVAADRDASGHLYVAWEDERNGGSHGDVYCQKLDSSGNRLWSTDVRVNAYPDALGIGLDLVSDASGTLYVVWSDLRNGDDDIYAQKLDSSGHRQWTADLPVNDGTANDQDSPAIALDDAGYFYVAWQDERNGEYDDDIYLQKFNTTGNRQWASDVQVNVDANSDDQSSPDLAVLGDRVFVAWTDHPSGYYLYGQMLDTDGNHLWTGDRGVCTEGAYNALASVVPGTADAFYITWGWRQHGWDDFDIHAQRIDTNGSTYWGDTGIQIAYDTGTARQSHPAITVDQEGYLYAVWRDERDKDPNNDNTWAFYAQKYDALGNRQWANDVRVNGMESRIRYSEPEIAIDDAGSVWITWDDDRDGSEGIYLQKLDAAGNRTWAADLWVNPGGWGPSVRTHGSSLYLVWSDYPDIYLQKLDDQGRPQWTTAKRVNATTGDGLYRYCDLDTGPGGDVYVTWYTESNTSDERDIFAQKIGTDGTRLWPSDIQVNTLITQGWQHPAIAAGVGGAYVVWSNWYGNLEEVGCYMQYLDSNGYLQWPSEIQLSVPDDWDMPYWLDVTTDGDGNAYAIYDMGRGAIYAQKVNTAGTTLWGNGIKVNSDSNARYHYESRIVVDASDRIYAVWVDERGTDADIYAQRLDTAGTKQWFSDLRVVNPDASYKPYSLAYSTVVDTTPDLILAATLLADYTLNGGTLYFYLSNDGGNTWENVTPGVAHTFASTGSDLRWLIVLYPDDTKVRTPIIHSLRIEYSTDLDTGDDYEPDDTCAQAQPIAVNGAAQQHTFHDQGDADWVWFQAAAGTTYIIQTANTGPNADTVLELYDACDQPPSQSEDNPFGPGAVITFDAPTSGVYYVQVHQHDPDVYGDGTDYELSVRAQTPSGAAIIVAGRLYTGDYRQPIINATANLAYQTFLDAGFAPDNIHYLNSDLSQPGVDDTPTWEHVRDAVQDWARTRVGLGIPLWLYLADHGNVDVFHNEVSEEVTAADLDLWLSNLEATSGVDQINVILDACHSGSFIDTQWWDNAGLEEISGPGRVIVASTTTRWFAYAPPIEPGEPAPVMYFSSGLWPALGQGQDLWHAFLSGRAAVEAAGQVCGDYDYTCQRPWLDDNGDAWFDADDGVVAQGRGLMAAFGGGIAPYIDWVTVGEVEDGRATVRAQVRDDGSVARVWARLFAPSWEPPTSEDGSTPLIDVPEVELNGTSGDMYEIEYSGFDEEGAYQVVVYALDEQGNAAIPKWVWVGQQQVFLPLVMKNR